MLARKAVLSACSLFTLLAAVGIQAGGCAATGAEDDLADVEEGDDLQNGVAGGVKDAVVEQIWFKAGNGYRRIVRWSSDPQYAATGGFRWSEATPFELLPESWWGTGLPSRDVRGFEAFTIGSTLHEQIWVVVVGRTVRFDRTRDVRTGAFTPWVGMMKDNDIPCAAEGCMVTAWSVVLSEGKMMEAVWRGKTAHLRESDVTVNNASGTYSLGHPGAWKEFPLSALKYQPGQGSTASIISQQGLQFKLDSPIGSDCVGRPSYGKYMQAWTHSDGWGYTRYVGVGADSRPLWGCNEPLQEVRYSLSDAPYGDASLHLLYFEEGGGNCVQRPPGSLERGVGGCGGAAHRGIDYTTPVGTEIRAGISGKVVSLSTSYPSSCWKPQGGSNNPHNANCDVACENNEFNYIKIAAPDPKQPGNDLVLWYVHIQDVAPGIVEGKEIKQGEVIAYSGNSGCSSGPHIHLQAASTPRGSYVSMVDCAAQRDPEAYFCK